MKTFAKKSGVTVVEVVIAALILAVAFIPILRAVTSGSVFTAKTEYYAKAARLAQQLVEECKHVPFRVYQDTYVDLINGGSFEVNEQFYKETQKSIEEFFAPEIKKGVIKKYGVVANLTAKKNNLEQISELWFEVEIYWLDKGNLDGDKTGNERSVRYGNAYYNSEAI